MNTDKQNFVYAHFRDEPSAARAVRSLIDASFASEDIGVLMRDHGEGELERVPLEHKTGMRPGALLGTALGVAVGAAALPATPVIALGGALGVLGGAAVGGAAGTLGGVLGGLGAWNDKLAAPASSFEEGGVLVGALAPSERVTSAQAALSAAGASNVDVVSQSEARPELRLDHAKGLAHSGAPVNPDKLARNIFLLTLAYVLAVGGSIWLFIRPV